MNRIKNYFSVLILSALIGYSAQHNKIFAMEAEADQSEKPIIIFDLDDTLIDVDQWNAYRSILWQSLPWNFVTLVRLKSKRSPDKYGNKRFKAANSEQLAPGGGATSLGFYGLYGNNSADFQQLVPTILDIIWQNAQFVRGAKTLLDYLQQKKYPIVYATNKDYTSYVHVAKTMDEKYQNAFSNYPAFVLVTHPNKADLEQWSYDVKQNKNIPNNFSQLINEICTATEDKSKRIYFADGSEKPENEYYVKLKELMNNKLTDTRKYIFFDDKDINIKIGKKHGIDGYTIKTVADIVGGLEKQGVLNQNKDALLYNDLAKEGVFGVWKKIAAYTYIKTPSKIAG